MQSHLFRLAHSLFLSRFLRPALPNLNGNERQLAEWTTALGESPESALDRFKTAGLLVPFSPTGDDMLASPPGLVSAGKDTLPSLPRGVAQTNCVRYRTMTYNCLT
jgi:hypothetical protein